LKEQNPPSVDPADNLGDGQAGDKGGQCAGRDGLPGLPSVSRRSLAIGLNKLTGMNSKDTRPNEHNAIA
jgi:hypothetical protein